MAEKLKEFGCDEVITGTESIYPGHEMNYGALVRNDMGATSSLSPVLTASSDLLSDDIAPLDLGASRVHPFPRAVAVDDMDLQRTGDLDPQVGSALAHRLGEALVGQQLG